MSSNIPQPTPITQSSLQNMDFNQLVELYQNTITQYQSLYSDFLNNYNTQVDSVTCGISRAYYWGNRFNFDDKNYVPPPQSIVTNIARNSFDKYLSGDKTPFQVTNDSMGLDPQPGVSKQLWIDYTNNSGQTGTLNFSEGSNINWSVITSPNNPGLKDWMRGCENSPNSRNFSGLKKYMDALEVMENNVELINQQITLYIEQGDPQYFANLDKAYKNSTIINEQYNKLKNMRKQILAETFKYEPPLENSSIFVKQSNYLYILIFGLFFVTIYIFVYIYFDSFKASLGQTGGARGKNYLLLFVLFVVLAIILKFLS